MSERTLHPLAAEYLRRLRRAARELPPDQRSELSADIEAHLRETTSPASSTSEVLNTLSRLGEPNDIVDAQRAPTDVRTDNRQTGREGWVIALLLFGGFAFGIGWVIGVALLWRSPEWSKRDKWLGTLVLPGGFALVPLAVLLSSSAQSCLTRQHVTHCSGGSDVGSTVIQAVILTVTVLAPIVTAIHLRNRLQSLSGIGTEWAT